MNFLKNLLIFKRDGILDNPPNFRLFHKGRPMEFALEELSDGACCLAIVGRYFFVYLKWKNVYLVDKLVALKDESIFSYIFRTFYDNIDDYIEKKKIKIQVVMKKSLR